MKHTEQTPCLREKAEHANISRKNFFRRALALMGALIVSNHAFLFKVFAGEKTLKPRPGRKVTTAADLAVVRGDDPAKLVRSAVAALGGIGRFVRRGDAVVIKPNIGWNRAPEYAANTNPEIVAALVKMCRDAGAKSVKIFDNTCNSAKMCYANSGIAESARKAGASVYHFADWKCYPGEFPEGSLMAGWPVFKDGVECDCFINVPVAKHHSLTGLTLSMKNLMGVCGGSRGDIHRKIDRKLSEITRFIKPDLTVIDAYRILTKHGPSGGSLKDVKLVKTVIAGTDPVLADSYATTLFGLTPDGIEHIKNAAASGLGSMDLKAARIKKITI